MKIHTLSETDFSKLAKSEPKANVRLRLLMMAHLQQGATTKEAAKNLFVSRITIRRWLNRYLNSGVDGLRDKPKSGCPFKLPIGEHECFKKRVLML